MGAEPIPGLVLVRHVGGGVDVPDDPTKPWALDVNLKVPGFMDFTFALLYGGAEILRLQADGREALDEFVRRQDMLNHPRLRTLKITGPEGVVFEQVGRNGS